MKMFMSGLALIFSSNLAMGNTVPGKNWGFAKATDVGLAERQVSKAINGLKSGPTSCAVIVKNGKIISEHKGQSAGQAYSTGKSVIGTAIGIAYTQGLLRLEDRGPDWTIREHLQQFHRGKWDYEALSGQNNAVKILDQYAGDGIKYVKEQVFEKLGMSSTRFVSPMGRSFFRSTCRDMARFGLLLAREGVWGSERLIAEDYWNEAVTAVPTNAAYGYLYWLNKPGRWASSTPFFRKRDRRIPIPGAPENMVYAKGFRGQVVMAFPDQDLVVVRMGDNNSLESMPEVYRIWDNVAPLLK